MSCGLARMTCSCVVADSDTEIPGDCEDWSRIRRHGEGTHYARIYLAIFYYYA